ncbi:phage holin family protein [Lacticaseibacillus mingshuiensis]|uniref:Phage holin family protein n=1 Tax=Lacticaseibacillus mingshuiensis TaxID=2799574 RepID=A0ABW4CHD2_9LACO|nr:phage holin family protein [Lacticaseibacillus mingshuiensis]
MDKIFSGGLPIVGWWFTVVGLDLVTGYAKALKQHNWRSAVNLQGLMIKFGTFATLIAASAIDHVAPIVGVTMPLNLGLWWTAMLIFYEIGSILENVSEIGFRAVGLMKYLAIFRSGLGDADDTTKKPAAQPSAPKRPPKAEADVEADIEADAEADTDTDADTDAETDAETYTDTDTETESAEVAADHATTNAPDDHDSERDRESEEDHDAAQKG